MGTRIRDGHTVTLTHGLTMTCTQKSDRVEASDMYAPLPHYPFRCAANATLQRCSDCVESDTVEALECKDCKEALEL